MSTIAAAQHVTDDAREVPAVAVAGLAKAFGPKQVLRDVALQAPKGKALVIVGCSGTGKSVLLKIILGLLQQDRGTILWGGQDVSSWRARQSPEMRAKFGMLFQGGALFDSIPVWENITFGLRQRQRLGVHVRQRKREPQQQAVLRARPPNIWAGAQRRGV
jgi:phospholipid/cholesterol/gamma-HCH transport system ATP-binding protein